MRDEVGTLRGGVSGVRFKRYPAIYFKRHTQMCLEGETVPSRPIAIFAKSGDFGNRPAVRPELDFSLFEPIFYLLEDVPVHVAVEFQGVESAQCNAHLGLVFTGDE